MQLLKRVIFQDQSGDVLSRRKTLGFLVWEEEEEEEEEEGNTLECEIRRASGLHCQSVLAKQYITLSLFLTALSLKYINVSRSPSSESFQTLTTLNRFARHRKKNKKTLLLEGYCASQEMIWLLLGTCSLSMYIIYCIGSRRSEF